MKKRKKILSAALAAMVAVSMFSFVGCGKEQGETGNQGGTGNKGGTEKAEELKLGLGVASTYGKSTSADGEINGSTEVNVAAAAVLLDKDGKIVKCVIDVAQNKALYGADGKGIANEDFKTKGELGADYGMAAHGTDRNGDGVVKEWNEQRDGFISCIEGKTIDEVKALVVEGYGNDDVVAAGCTMAISDFVTAVEKAVANVAASKATADDTLQLGIVTTQSVKDATEEKEGSNELDTTITAAVVGKDGKIVAASTDMLQAKITFDTAGACTTDTAKELKTKKELGADYGMAAHGTDKNGDGVVKEWDEQAAAFDAALAGLDAAGIAALESDGYGVESVQKAGCTIAISDLVKAAVKAATVK